MCYQYMCLEYNMDYQNSKDILTYSIIPYPVHDLVSVAKPRRFIHHLMYVLITDIVFWTQIDSTYVTYVR